MSTSLLYHVFGIRGYQYTRTDYSGGQTVFTIYQKPETCRCSACGSPEVQMRGRVERRFRTVPIGSRATFVVLPIPRVECQVCGVVRQVKVPFADPRRSYTSAFVRYALDLGRRMTIRDVAKHLGVSWDVIKDIQKRYLSRRFAKVRLKHLRQLAIDEISIAKRHRYLTIVMDLESGAVVFVGDGKGAKARSPFGNGSAAAGPRSRRWPWTCRRHIARQYRPTSARRRSCSIVSMSSSSSMRNSPNFVVTCSARRPRCCTSRCSRGLRWLLLKNPENLDEKRDEKRRLEEALAINKSLAVAYYMKEDLRQIWEQPGKRFATAFLNDWIKRAEVSGIRMLQQMAKTLATHRSGILAYYDVRITSGPMEGTNNKIKTMKRQAYGFRDREFLKLKILAIHESRYELVG